MFKQDKRSKDEIADTIEWSQQHYFWRDNILSTRKLRKNYGQLRIQMEKDATYLKRTVDVNPKITAEIIEHFEKAFLGKKVKWEIYDKGSFVIAAQRSVELADKSNLLLKNIPTLLIKCLKKWQMENNKTVEPSYVKSNHTWDVLLPQYFADVGLSVHEK